MLKKLKEQKKAEEWLNMRITYEFNDDLDNGDFFQLKVFQRANEMYRSLFEIETYIHNLRKGHIEDDVDTIIEELTAIINESTI